MSRDNELENVLLCRLQINAINSELMQRKKIDFFRISMTHLYDLLYPDLALLKKLQNMIFSWNLKPLPAFHYNNHLTVFRREIGFLD